MRKLLHGLHHFQTEIHAINTEFFGRLAKGQSPDAVFITCSDSRVVPALLTLTAPGQLFIIRNAGNIVPARDDSGGEEATIEYAVNALGVRDIIICGHTQCGAIKGLLRPETLSDLPAVGRWLRHAEETKRILDTSYHEQDFDSVLDIAIRENVLVQLEHLRTLSCVARLLWKREIELHGWVYDIETGSVSIYDPIEEDFLPVVKADNGFQLVKAPL